MRLLPFWRWQGARDERGQGIGTNGWDRRTKEELNADAKQGRMDVYREEGETESKGWVGVGGLEAKGKKKNG